MSDSSGDSSVGVEPYAVDTALLDQNNIHSEDQKPGRTSSSSGESDSESSSDEEDSNTALVEATPMSKELGFVDIFAMKTKMDEIHAWLKEVVDGSTGEHVYIPKSALRHHKRAVDGMRHCLRDTGPMAAK
jgi:U3 small nucleolar RNA-associated protein 14